jgi:hypothetical protein
MLGQRFDQGYAERPDVRRRRNPLAGDLRRVINTERPKLFVNLAHDLKAVPGNFQLIANDHNVRRFQMTMHETFSVKIEKRVEDRGEHLLSLTGREGSFRNNLGQNFLRKLCHGVDEPVDLGLTTSGMKRAD